jgi:hypothetical protein
LSKKRRKGMGFLKKLFSGMSGVAQRDVTAVKQREATMVEQREVTIRVEEDIVGKKGMNDPSALMGMLLAFINKNPHQIDSEIMDFITKKRLSIKGIKMTKTADNKGTDVTYLIEFS